MSSMSSSLSETIIDPQSESIVLCSVSGGVVEGGVVVAGVVSVLVGSDVGVLVCGVV